MTKEARGKRREGSVLESKRRKRIKEEGVVAYDKCCWWVSEMNSVAMLTKSLAAKEGS